MKLCVSIIFLYLSLLGSVYALEINSQDSLNHIWKNYSIDTIWYNAGTINLTATEYDFSLREPIGIDIISDSASLSEKAAFSIGIKGKIKVSNNNFRCLFDKLLNSCFWFSNDSAYLNKYHILYISLYSGNNVRCAEIYIEKNYNILLTSFRNCLLEKDVQTIMKFIDPENRYHQE